LTTAAQRLKLLGTVFEKGGLAFTVRDIWAEVPDAFSQMGADMPGDIHLTLRGDVAEASSANTVSLTGFGPATWGETRAAAETALGSSFSLLQMNGGCSQGTIVKYPHLVFGIQDGLLAVVAGNDKSIATDTGLHIGDSISALKAAYPGITIGVDPSDAYTTVYEYTKNGRTAQFLSYHGQTIDYMQFGLSTSVGEAPCV
jgi:hypothetical protein